jgi:hypothetical protein
VVLLAPGLPRPKEWAYAAIPTNMTGAAASHLATHQSINNLITPGMLTALAILSWALRCSLTSPTSPTLATTAADGTCWPASSPSRRARSRPAPDPGMGRDDRRWWRWAMMWGRHVLPS